MKPGCLVIILLLSSIAVAKEVPVSGTVTYVAAGVVYTSLGRVQGIDEDSRLWITKGGDTVTVLRVVALSSKSSACSVLTSRGDVKVGSIVTALVRLKQNPADAGVSGVTPPPAEVAETGGDSPGTRSAVERRPAAFEVRGRVSAQLRTVDYSGDALTVRQPGLVLSLQGRSGLVPITADLYANLRTASYGSGGLFSKGATNQSRVYRLSLTYDDGVNAASLGRTVSPYAWTLGTIDGLILSRKWRGWRFGAAAGLQPEGGSRGVSTASRKVGLFASYEFGGEAKGYATAVYARTYRVTDLDRETVSGLVNVAVTPDLSLYGSGEIDLRRKRGDGFVLRPALTSMYVNMSYRVSRGLRVGVGGDASRPVFSFSDVRTLPDSLIERRLVWGVSFVITVSPVQGISLSNTLTPRSRGSAPLREYADYAALTVSDLASTGVLFRSDVNFSRSEYTSTMGFGGGLQRQLFEGIDLAVRYHRSRFTLLRGGVESFSTTVGADIVVPIIPAVVMFASYEYGEGYGTHSRSIMAELSVRF